jgi:hypothetical protein
MPIQTWSLLLRWGSATTIEVPNNPSIDHNGLLSLHSLVLTHDEKEGLETILTQFSISQLWFGDLQNEDQKEEREILLALGRDEGEMPCSACLGCSWFDPRLKLQGAIDGCGLLWWGSDFGNQDKYTADAEACPLGRGFPQG